MFIILSFIILTLGFRFWVDLTSLTLCNQEYILIRDKNKKEVSYINPHLFSTGADVGQTARAATGDSSDRGAEQRQPAGGAVVMATVV